MPRTLRQFVAYGWLGAAVLCGAGCEPKRIPPMTVEDLLEDRVTLDGVLIKCNQHPDQARNNSDCLNARLAVERLAKNVDPTLEAKRKEEFERNRDRLRLAQERTRQAEEAKSKVDAYDLPVVPVNPAPASGALPQAEQPKP